MGTANADLKSKLEKLKDHADKILEPMPQLMLGDEAPNFTAESQVGSITLHDLIDGNWGLMVFFPKDFDPVLTTNLGMLSKLQEEFDQRETKIICVSADTKYQHVRWLDDTERLQDTKVGFPVCADDMATISKMYGLLRTGAYEDGPILKYLVQATTLMILDSDKRIQYITQYPTSVGVNFYEILRTIDALQLAYFHQVGTPANWRQSEDVFILPEVSNENAELMFPKGFQQYLRPWFRQTPQPDERELN